MSIIDQLLKNIVGQRLHVQQLQFNDKKENIFIIYKEIQ